MKGFEASNRDPPHFGFVEALEAPPQTSCRNSKIYAVRLCVMLGHLPVLEKVGSDRFVGKSWRFFFFNSAQRLKSAAADNL